MEIMMLIYLDFSKVYDKATPTKIQDPQVDKKVLNRIEM